jgi:NAD-specific glutamate dehydrogenase
MAPRKGSKGRQEHPKGPLDTVEEAEKKAIRGAVAQKEWNQKILAEKIPCSEGTISNLYQPGASQIRRVYRLKIYELLGWEQSDRVRAALGRIDFASRFIAADAVENVAGLLESFARKQQSGSNDNE